MSKIRIFVFALLLLGSFVQAQTPAAEEAIVFCKSYENYAWGATKNGFFVDSTGKVFSFNFSAEALEPGIGVKAPKTVAELKAEYNQSKKLLKTVAADELSRMRALIPEVLSASYSAKVHNACDAGCELWTAYLVDDEKGTFKAVKLKEDGDFVQNSLATAATTLVNWLDSLK